MVKLSQEWHDTCLELDWYPEVKGLVNVYIQRFFADMIFMCAWELVHLGASTDQ
jgi:hypothetical protein